LSGVGKSSLLAAIEPRLRLRTAEVSDRHHEGRHTTTQVNLLPLRAGGFVADTPGVREFGLSGLRRDELAGHYPEMLARASACRYGDCSHTKEPGCAVKAAVREGRIAPARYDSYRKIYASLPG
jgi:ribosome biogenesis GTPase